MPSPAELCLTQDAEGKTALTVAKEKVRLRLRCVHRSEVFDVREAFLRFEVFGAEGASIVLLVYLAM